MNNYKILIYNGMEYVDLSDIVSTNINIQDKLDLTFDSGQLVIPHAKRTYDSIPGIDFSKPIKPNTPVMIIINDGYEVFRFYTTDSNRIIIGKGNNKRYKHELNLVEPTRALFKKPIPDMSVTQPQSAVFEGKYFSELKSEQVEINNSETVVQLDIRNTSKDPSKIDGNVIKQGIKADIFVGVDFINEQYNQKPEAFLNQTATSAEVNMLLEIYANQQLVFSKQLFVPAGSSQVKGFFPFRYSELKDPGIVSYNESTTITPSIDSAITVKLKSLGKYEKCTEGSGCTKFEDTVKSTVYLTISTEKSDTNKIFKYINKEVIKIIDSVNLNYGTSYTLSPETYALTDIYCTELTFESYTAWDALEKLANIVNAIPEVGLTNFTEISFRFLDEEPDLVYDIGEFSDESMGYIYDDFNAGYEINAVNVIEEDSLENAKVEPYVGGWMTIRTGSDEISQLKEDNASFRTRQPIQKIYKFLIKGPVVKITNNNGGNTKNIYGNTGGSPEESSSYWDITDMVVETQRWNTYENGTQNKSDQYRLIKNTKGNNIHYTQGSKFIIDLGYKTDTVSTVIGTTVAPRALFEVIMKATAKMIQNNPGTYNGYEVLKATDGDPERAIVSNHKLFDGVMARVEYAPLSNMRSTVYRNDVFSMGVDSVQYINEQDKLNDTFNLGDYVKKSINKLGKIQYTISGRSKKYDTIPRLGYKTSDGKYISSRNISLSKNNVDYMIELSEGFINQSSHVGVRSAYRQYEVSDKEFVFRQDKYNEFVILSKSNALGVSDSNLELYGRRSIIDNFQKSTTVEIQNPVSYGRITITKDRDSNTIDNVVSFDMPINGLSLGNTINLQLEMEDNYSVGPRIDKLAINTDQYRTLNYAKYVNDIGSFYSFDLELRQRGTINNSEADANEYPISLNNTYRNNDKVIFNLSREGVNKDARERYGLNIQIPIISADEDIRVYQGFAKYSALIRDRSHMDLGFALLESGYNPSINDNYVDTSRIFIKDNYTATNVYDAPTLSYILIYAASLQPYTKIEGMVIYEQTTGELILSVRHQVDNDTSSPINITFPNIWSTHKKSLSTNTYPDNPLSVNVNWQTNGGYPIDYTKVIKNTRVRKPLTSRVGYKFDNWYNEYTLDTIYNFNKIVTGDITLYAKWIRL